jgi:lipopolysaccharide export system protein LptA
MVNLYPERLSYRFFALGLALLGPLTAFLAGGSTAYAQQSGQPRQEAPISIDAESSEFDYATSQLVFRRLRMEQGDLGIQADLAETDKLDFTDGLWVFTGNVILRTATAVLYCDEARLTFSDHKLAEAKLTGNPAHFEQKLDNTEGMNKGEASQIVYELESQSLKLQKSARFTDGANEISGDQIVYNLKARRLTADSGESGPVKILIETPNQLKEKTQTP